MKNVEITKLINQQNWHLLISNYTPDDICNALSFQKAMRLANNLFYEHLEDGAIQQFAVDLAFKIREHFKDQWNMDWKNDVFLGHLCSIIWRYDDQYECYKRAFNTLKDPPDSLLLLLAGSNNVPGNPLITLQESEEYLKRALEKKVTYEAALMMRALYKHKGERELEGYWDHMCETLK